MTTVINKDPVIQIDVRAIAEYPDGNKYCATHSYMVNSDNCDKGLLTKTLANIFQQRFPAAKSISFVGKKEYENAIKNGATEHTNVTQLDTVMFSKLPQ